MDELTKAVISGYVCNYDTFDGTWDVSINPFEDVYLSNLLKKFDGKHVRVTVEVIEGVE